MCKFAQVFQRKRNNKEKKRWVNEEEKGGWGRLTFSREEKLPFVVFDMKFEPKEEVEKEK
jgi:hypothetical protein